MPESCTAMESAIQAANCWYRPRFVETVSSASWHLRLGARPTASVKKMNVNMAYRRRCTHRTSDVEIIDPYIQRTKERADFQGGGRRPEKKEAARNERKPISLRFDDYPWVRFPVKEIRNSADLCKGVFK